MDFVCYSPLPRETMPPEKRSHGRITSGSMRPHKSARFGHEPGDEEEELANGDYDNDIPMDEQPFSTFASAYQSLDTLLVGESCKMRVSQVVAWPKSLAAIRRQILYNITPQEGPRLPDHVLRLVSDRILRPFSRDSLIDIIEELPYIHLGFTPFLNMQIFLFLPNLRLRNTSWRGRQGHICDEVLEMWTDKVLLPSIIRNDPRAPSSWRLANLYRHSPKWYDEDVAPFPVYKLHDSQNGQVFSQAWEDILDRSIKIPEFQHPFLLLYSDGEVPHFYYGSSPEGSMHEFEVSWHGNIDMTHVLWPEDNLKVDFDYGSQLQVKDLPMR